MEVVAVLAYNDPYVMAAWSKANGIKNDEIVCLFGFPFARYFRHLGALGLAEIMFIEESERGQR